MSDTARKLREDAEAVEGLTGGSLPYLVDNMKEAAAEIERLRELLRECWDRCDPWREWPWDLFDKVESELGLAPRATDSREDT